MDPPGRNLPCAAFAAARAAPVSQLEKAPGGGDVYRLQRRNLQSLSGGVDEVVEVAEVLKQRSHISIAQKVRHAALGARRQTRQRSIEAIGIAGGDDDFCALVCCCLRHG